MNSGDIDVSWASVWGHAFGLPTGTPQWVIAAFGLIFIYLAIILPSGAVMSYLDRKIGADFQARVGPNRAGAAGFLQPVADLMKLLQKEATIDWSWREALWLGVHTMALYSTVAVLPLGSLVLLVDTDMSAFLPFWATLVLSLGTMLLGLSQRSVPGWFGGVRISAQALAGAFPALVALLCAGVRAGGFRWSVLAGSQSASPLHWAAFSNPFQFIAFIVFVVAGLVLLGIPPMDAALSQPDIHGGVSSHLHGRRLSLFRLSRFYGFFLWSVIAVVLFLGAWELPNTVFGALKEAGSYGMIQLLELSVLLSKTFFLMLLVVWVARVNPRARVDQVTDFSWKVLSPFSLGALIGAGFSGRMESLLMESVFSTIRNYFRDALWGARSVIGSCLTAIPYLFSAGEYRKEVTEQYPDPISSRTADDLPARSRGLLYNDIERCTGCRECEMVCPTQCIGIETEPGPDASKIWVTTFDIDFSRCVFCGLCVEVCQPQSLMHTKQYEGAVYQLSAMVSQFGRGSVTQEQREKWAALRQMSEEGEEGLL